MPAGSQGLALLLPRTTEQVSRVLAFCCRANRKVVVQGGLTGLVQGAFTGTLSAALAPGGVRLGCARLTTLDDFRNHLMSAA